MKTETFTYDDLLSADEVELAKALAEGVAQARGRLDRDHPLRIGADEQPVDDVVTEYAPADKRQVIGRFATVDASQVERAIEVSAEAAPGWAATPVEERISILRSAADEMAARRFELAGLITHEVGKPGLESIAEADEAPVLLRIYCDRMEEARAFEHTMETGSDSVESVSVLLPYGVWAVISPFNFPLALAAGPTSAALVAGNTVIIKPSPAGHLCSVVLRDILIDAGVPPEAVIVLPGGGEVGEQLVSDPRVGGVTFTGSFGVGAQIMRSVAETGKPVICEMGGKNPTLVSASADLDAAAEGVARAAFGYSGQKCSSCSRAFVEASVYDDFVSALCEQAESMAVGDPAKERVFTGPLISEAAAARFRDTVAAVKAGGGKILAGGEVLTEGPLSEGNFVSPTVVEVPDDVSSVWSEELFLPLVAVAPYEEFTEAIERANETEFGLTAGLFSGDDEEVDRFMRGVQASVLYVNRRSGSTTGAWPGIQPISGWGHSGNTGKGTGGFYYLQQYVREQSRNVVSGD